MEFSLDENKALELAKELGLEVTFNNESSGVKLGDSIISFDDFFPELNDLNNDYITKDYGIFSKEVVVKNRVIVVKVKTTDTLISSAKNKQLMCSA